MATCLVFQKNDGHWIHADGSYRAAPFCYPQAKEGWSGESYTNDDLLRLGRFDIPSTPALQYFCSSSCKFYILGMVEQFKTYLIDIYIVVPQQYHEMNQSRLVMSF